MNSLLASVMKATAVFINNLVQQLTSSVLSFDNRSRYDIEGTRFFVTTKVTYRDFMYKVIKASYFPAARRFSLSR